MGFGCELGLFAGVRLLHKSKQPCFLHVSRNIRLEAQNHAARQELKAETRLEQQWQQRPPSSKSASPGMLVKAWGLGA